MRSQHREAKILPGATQQTTGRAATPSRGPGLAPPASSVFHEQEWVGAQEGGPCCPHKPSRVRDQGLGLEVCILKLSACLVTCPPVLPDGETRSNWESRLLERKRRPLGRHLSPPVQTSPAYQSPKSFFQHVPPHHLILSPPKAPGWAQGGGNKSVGKSGGSKGMASPPLPSVLVSRVSSQWKLPE